MERTVRQRRFGCSPLPSAVRRCRTVTSNALDAALRPRRSRVGGGEGIGAGRQGRRREAPAPLLLAVVVPSALVPPSDTVTVEPAGAVPVKVTELLALTVPLLMAGAAGVWSPSHRTGSMRRWSPPKSCR